jgi:thiol-disulfide isomerase/thioredoxin
MLARRTRHLRISSLFAFLCVWSSLCLTSTTVKAEKKPPLWIESEKRKGANLTADLRTLDGKPFSLAEYQGKTIFLNYWATWCKPCKEELPSIAALHKKLHADGLEAIAFTNEKPDKVKKFLEDKDFPFTIVLDPKDTLGKRFNLNIVPSTLVIDGAGKIALSYAGEFDWSSPAIVQGVQSVMGQGGRQKQP